MSHHSWWALLGNTHIAPCPTSDWMQDRRWHVWLMQDRGWHVPLAMPHMKAWVDMVVQESGNPQCTMPSHQCWPVPPPEVWAGVGSKRRHGTPGILWLLHTVSCQDPCWPILLPEADPGWSRQGPGKQVQGSMGAGEFPGPYASLLVCVLSPMPTWRHRSMQVLA